MELDETVPVGVVWAQVEEEASAMPIATRLNVLLIFITLVVWPRCSSDPVVFRIGAFDFLKCQNPKQYMKASWSYHLFRFNSIASKKFVVK